VVTRLSKNPTLLTALLSGAAIAGYVAYRLTAGNTEGEEARTAAATDHQDHAVQAEPRPMLDALPEIVLNNIEGEPTALSEFAGKPLLINYWATWCAPCLREIPLLKAFQDEHPNIEVIGIAADHVDPVREFAAEMEFNYTVLVGQTEAMNAAAALGVEVVALPFTVFTAPDGAVIGIHTGEIHAEHLDNLAATLASLETGEIDRAAARAQLAGLR
jgi:thiol-disulfide isomerase/thioredoxin